jgi:hypothetical protein
MNGKQKPKSKKNSAAKKEKKRKLRIFFKKKKKEFIPRNYTGFLCFPKKTGNKLILSKQEGKIFKIFFFLKRRNQMAQNFQDRVL